MGPRWAGYRLGRDRPLHSMWSHDLPRLKGKENGDGRIFQRSFTHKGMNLRHFGGRFYGWMTKPYNVKLELVVNSAH